MDFEPNDLALQPWIEQGVTFVKDRVTPQNLGTLLDWHMSPGDLLISWQIDFLGRNITMSAETLKGIWLDRDLTWLEFNRRVLAEALDDRTPLLERLKFLAIFTSNLDEFFMKRVALLRVENDGTHTRLLVDLRAVIVAMVQQQQACFASLLPQLEQHGIRILGWKDLSDRQRLESTKFFRENVLPALTPLVVDSVHPTPFLSNLSLSWGCRLREPGSDAPLYGRVKVATGLPPWIRSS